VRLVACPDCHTQYDVTDVAAERFPCRCGKSLENRPLEAVDAEVRRCGSCGALVVREASACGYCGSAIEHDPRRLSLICPECYARCADDARFCTACGVAFRPEPVRAEGHELPCPACSALMPPRSVAGVPVNECGRCNGLWVAGDGFERLVNRAIEALRGRDPGLLPERAPRTRGANPAGQRVQYRKCPECDAFMQRRNFRRSSGVIVDACRRHGTWLDADELEQIAGFVLSGGRSSPLLEPEPPAAQARASAELARLRAIHTRPQATGREPNGLVGALLDALHRLL
jgi:Zn-finger nucleic acid-binding protein